MEGSAIIAPADAIRLRPSMYVGDISTPNAVKMLVRSALSLSVDQAERGLVHTVEVNVSGDALHVCDDGPGVPLDDEDRLRGFLTSFLMAAVRPEWDSWHERLSLGGLGVLNALGAYFRFETRCARGTRVFDFANGREIASQIVQESNGCTGTTISWTADRSILSFGVSVAVVEEVLLELKPHLSAATIRAPGWRSPKKQQ